MPDKQNIGEIKVVLVRQRGYEGGMPKAKKRRPSKRHVQMEMLTKDGTRKKDRRGGVRKPGKGKKLGRPAAPGKRPSERHEVRPKVKPGEPLHIVIRMLPIVATLRDAEMYAAIQKATVVAGRNVERFRIVHISIQDNHIHLIVEAASKDALASGMKGFQISAAKWINQAITKSNDKAAKARGKGPTKRRRGSVFADRYHAEPITTPKYARHVIAYVLNNWRKHGTDRGPRASALVDRFSSGVTFDGWKELAERGLERWDMPDGHEPLFVHAPRSWLLRTGWKRYGLVGCHEVPTTLPNAE